MLLGGHGGVRVQGEARDESGRVGPGLTRTLPRWLGSVSSRGATAWLPSLNKRSELEGGRGGGGGGLVGPWPRGWWSFLWWGGAADPEEALKTPKPLAFFVGPDLEAQVFFFSFFFFLFVGVGVVGCWQLLALDDSIRSSSSSPGPSGSAAS